MYIFNKSGSELLCANNFEVRPWPNHKAENPTGDWQIYATDIGRTVESFNDRATALETLAVIAAAIRDGETFVEL